MNKELEELYERAYHAGYEKGFTDGHAKERWLKEQVEKDAILVERKRAAKIARKVAKEYDLPKTGEILVKKLYGE
jgi:hypothetical protein